MAQSKTRAWSNTSGQLKSSLSLLAILTAIVGLFYYASNTGQLVTFVFLTLFTVSAVLAVSSAVHRFIAPLAIWTTVAFFSLLLLPVAQHEKAIHGSDSSLTLNKVYRFFQPIEFETPGNSKIGVKLQRAKLRDTKTLEDQNMRTLPMTRKQDFEHRCA